MLKKMLMIAGFLTALLPCPGVAADNAAWRNIAIAATPHQLRGDAEADEPLTIGKLVYRGGLHLTSDDPAFGGFSGLVISPDGGYLIAISDRAQWFAGLLNYDDDGRLAGITDGRMAALTGADGAVIANAAADAEALVNSGNQILVGFERRNRVDAYAPDEAGVMSFQENVGVFDDDAIPYNKGIEAITQLKDGRLLALSEAAADPHDRDEGAYAGWLWRRGEKAAALSYQPGARFNPTDAALAPDGDVIVLERAFSRLLGVRARLTRLKESNIKPGARLVGEELARFNAAYAIDNMEGVAITSNDKGRTLIYLISDDNHSGRQKTLLLMFELI